MEPENIWFFLSHLNIHTESLGVSQCSGHRKMGSNYLYLIIRVCVLKFYVFLQLTSFSFVNKGIFLILEHTISINKDLYYLSILKKE